MHSADSPKFRLRESVEIVGVTQVEACKILFDDEIQGAIFAAVNCRVNPYLIPSCPCFSLFGWKKNRNL